MIGAGNIDMVPFGFPGEPVALLAGVQCLMVACPAGRGVLFVICVIEGDALHLPVIDGDKRFLGLIAVRSGSLRKLFCGFIFSGMTFRTLKRACLLRFFAVKQVAVDALRMRYLSHRQPFFLNVRSFGSKRGASFLTVIMAV